MRPQYALFNRMGMANMRIGDGSSMEETDVADNTRELENMRIYQQELQQQTKVELAQVQTITLPSTLPESVREVSEEVIELVRRPNPQPEVIVDAVDRLIRMRDSGPIDERKAAAAMFDNMLHKLYMTQVDLVIAKQDIEKLEEALQQPPLKKTRPAAALMPHPAQPPAAAITSPVLEKDIVAEWVIDLNNIVRRGLSRVTTFCGAVSVRLREMDERKMYKWDPDLNKSIDDRLEMIQLPNLCSRQVSVWVRHLYRSFWKRQKRHYQPMCPCMCSNKDVSLLIRVLTWTRWKKLLPMVVRQWLNNSKREVSWN